MRAPWIPVSSIMALAAGALYLGCADLAGLDGRYGPRPDTGTGASGGASSTGGASSSGGARSIGGGGTGGTGGGGGSKDPCANGQRDPGETDVDCGGPSCMPCGKGLACGAASDCASRYCGDDKLCHGIIAVTAGELHTCALTDENKVKCWGDNTHDQLGYVGPGTSTPTDVTIPGGASVVSAGGYFNCASPASPGSGSVVCWGDDSSEELGNPVVGDYPMLETNGSNGKLFVESAGAEHVCTGAPGQSGATCWGSDAKKQLGDGQTTNVADPVPVGALSGKVKALASGQFHSCAIVGGAAHCWGNNSYGQRGDNSLGALAGLSRITAGATHNCALQNAQVWCWGNNADHQLSGTSPGNKSSTPVKVAHLGATEIAAGDAHTCAIAVDSTVWCWGNNLDGALGLDVGITGEQQPRPIPNLVGAKLISAGGHHTCAILENGSLVCWGADAAGQAGVAPADAVVPFEPVTFP